MTKAKRNLPETKDGNKKYCIQLEGVHKVKNNNSMYYFCWILGC